MSELVTLPDGNWVRLASKLSLTAGAGVMAAIRGAESTESEVEAAIAAAFLRHGIEEWSYTTKDKEGKELPVPITNVAIAERLDWATAHDVSEKCNELYAADLFRPLVSRMAKSSPTGPKDESTSPPTDSGAPPPAPSKPSSRHGSGGKRSGARAR